MAAIISSLPIERVAARAVVGHSLGLRRIALHMTEAYKLGPTQSGNFYWVNRDKFFKLEQECGKLDQDLRGVLADFAPDLFKTHETNLARL